MADFYRNPLVARYASAGMSELFGAQRRVRTWRQVWLALAESQAELGLPISAKQIGQLRKSLDDIDLAKAAEYEKKLRHDVMAHLHAWGDAAPAARGILHLGATSMDIVDNADLIIQREAMTMVRDWLVNVILGLSRFACTYRDVPCLGYTHFQPAQLTTVGRRACLWAYDFVRDLEGIDHRLTGLRFRGIRGATGTQASFLTLFGGDARKVARLEKKVAARLGFKEVEPITGQTYSRKVDAEIVACLGHIATSAHKFANDIRLLAGLKEIEEPFEEDQVGSSAMAYKRNPMRCERVTGLSRYVLSLVSSAMQTAAEQWLERTLDDSSNKRIVMAEGFLATDGILRIATDVARGLVVYPKVIESRVMAELPFMATEEILMAAATSSKGKRKGSKSKVEQMGDRQALHERLRQHSQAAAREVKMHGQPNDLLCRLAADPAFAAVDLDRALAPQQFVGLAPQQVDNFLSEVIQPILHRYRSVRRLDAALDV